MALQRRSAFHPTDKLIDSSRAPLNGEPNWRRPSASSSPANGYAIGTAGHEQQCAYPKAVICR